MSIKDIKAAITEALTPVKKRLEALEEREERAAKSPRTTVSTLVVHFPQPVVFSSRSSAALAGDAEEAFSIDAQGTGSFTGLAYTVPAHTKGKLEAYIQVMAIGSEDVKQLRDLVMSMLDASHKKEIKEHEETKASANVSFWSLFGGGASASYTKTRDTMESWGLTPEQITKIIDKMFEIASKMSHVKLDFEIDNSANDYAVSGDLYLYTISGSVKTEKGTRQYRVLADKGSAAGAPATGSIIPLS